MSVPGPSGSYKNALIIIIQKVGFHHSMAGGGVDEFDRFVSMAVGDQSGMSYFPLSFFRRKKYHIPWFYFIQLHTFAGF